MELKATVIQALPIERGVSRAGKEWEKATLIVQYGDAKYPKKVALMALKNAEKFAAVPVGSEVVFQVDVESHEFNGKWYTSVTCWKWDVLGGSESSENSERSDCQGVTPPLPTGDDLPF